MFFMVSLYRYEAYVRDIIVCIYEVNLSMYSYAEYLKQEFRARKTNKIQFSYDSIALMSRIRC